MMPLFPFYILMAVDGGREFFKWLANFMGDTKLVNGLNIILLAAAVIYFGAEYNKNKIVYQDQSRHIYIRQVETAKWLKNNTPEGSVIATHDVGAIAFYSGRKVIDVVGLINPEFIQKLNTKEFVSFVEDQIKKQNVSYLAFLREWFQVVNQAPLFTAGENNFEIMQVYKYFPDKTHILSSEVNAGIEYASQMLSQKQYQQALNVYKKLITMDPNSSLTFYLTAYTYTALGDTKSAEQNLKKALEIFPEYREAAISLSSLYKNQNRIDDARSVLGSYLSLNPKDSIAAKQYNSLQAPVNNSIDSLKTK
jgi:tetratricopeptide (TPR) repeat protein